MVVLIAESTSLESLVNLAGASLERAYMYWTRIEGVDVVSANGVLPFRGSTAPDTVARELEAAIEQTQADVLLFATPWPLVSLGARLQIPFERDRALADMANEHLYSRRGDRPTLRYDPVDRS